MNANLSALLNKLESRKAAMLAETSRWPAERMRFKPSATAWSALDIFDHLVKTEAGALRAANGNIGKSRPVGLKENVLAWVLIGVMQSPLRVKVPATASAVLPGKAPDLALIVPRWEKVRVEMADLAGRLTPAQLKSGVFQHPVSGWMTMPQLMGFLSAHLRHHQYQFERLKKAGEACR